VRSNVARRSNCSRPIGLLGVTFAASCLARMNRSIGVFAHEAFFTVGTGTGLSERNAQ